MDKTTLLKLMREDYQNRDLKSLRRHFAMSAYHLRDETALKRKIEGAIRSLERESGAYKSLPPLVRYWLELDPGSRIVR